MADELTPTERLLDDLRLRGVASARELSETLGLSQPSISRALATAGSRVTPIGQARRRRYASVRDVRGLGTHWPLYRIDTHGQPHAFGQLTALHGARCLVTTTPTDWLQGEFADGLFPAAVIGIGILLFARSLSQEKMRPGPKLSAPGEHGSASSGDR